MDFYNARGRRLAELDGSDDLERYGARGVVLRRARLHAELAERAQGAGATFEFDSRLVELRRQRDGVEAVSPSTGQGASLAIEDAAVLAHRMQHETSTCAVFEGFTSDGKERAEKIVRFGRQIGARKVSSAAGNLFRDLTLSMFLRMGGKAAVEQYGYRVPEEPADSRSDRP